MRGGIGAVHAGAGFGGSKTGGYADVCAFHYAGTCLDTYVTREDWRDTLRAMDGTALSESYADISAQEKGLYYEVANENGVNQTGLMDAAGTLLIPMTYSDFTYVGNGWVVAVTLEETTDEKSDYRSLFGSGHYNVVRGDIYYGAQKMAEMNREETTGASMEVYGAYLFVRLDKSSGFYLKTDGTRTEFTGESFSRGEYEEIYKQGVYHHPTAQFAFVPECTLTADEVSRSVWYDAKTGDFLDLQGNVLREAGRTASRCMTVCVITAATYADKEGPLVGHRGYDGAGNRSADV